MIQLIEADLSIPEHADAVLDLLNEYAQDTMGGGTGLSDFVRQNLIATLHKRPGTYIVLALSPQSPVGLLIAFEGFSTFACKPLINIHDIIVSGEYRGQGVGKQLIAKIEEIAHRSGACKLTLEVLEGNKVARGLYEACGFTGYELTPETGKALFWQKKLI